MITKADFIVGALSLTALAVLLCGLVMRAIRWRTAGRTPERIMLTPHDDLTLRQLYEGCIIFGATGSGKTSGPGDAIARLLLRSGAGILVLTAKSDDCDRWLTLCARTGRRADFIRFGPGSGHVFDFLNYELAATSVEAAAALMQVLVEVTSRTSAQQGSEQYWILAAARHIQLAIAAVFLAWGRCDVSDVYRFMTDPPTKDNTGTASWRDSFCGKTLTRLADLPATPEIQLIGDYWMSENVALSEKTKSVIFSMCVNVLSRFMLSGLGSLLRGESTVTPDAVLEGKVVVIDCPVLVHREPGQLVQVVWKVLTQRAALRRKGGSTVAIFADESQLTALPGIDASTQAVARSHKLIQINITQNLPLLYAALGGGEKARQEAEAWVANCQTKIVCANGCNTTNTFFSELCGSSRHLFFSGNAQTGGDYDLLGDMMGTYTPQGSASFSEQWHPDLPPGEPFSTLRKGSLANGMVVDAYVFQGGRRFSTGKTWVKASFIQE